MVPDRHCPFPCPNGPGPCKGGGNKKCIQRDQNYSVLVLIIDTYGGSRVVVTHPNAVHHHVRHDELPIIAPGLKLHEPIAWDNIPMVIARAEYEADKWIEQRGIPNDPVQRECVENYLMRKKIHPDSRRSLDLTAIAYT